MSEEIGEKQAPGGEAYDDVRGQEDRGEARLENVVRPDALPGALTPGADVLGRTA